MSNLYDLFPNLKQIKEEETPPIDIKLGEEFSLWNKDPKKAQYNSQETLATGDVKATGVESPMIYKDRFDTGIVATGTGFSYDPSKDTLSGQQLTGGGITTDIMNPVVDTEAMAKESAYRKKWSELLKQINTNGNDLETFRKLSPEDQQAVTDARQRETDRQNILAQMWASDYQKRAYNKELDGDGGALWAVEKNWKVAEESMVDLLSLGYAERWDWHKKDKISDIVSGTIAGEVVGNVAGIAWLFLWWVELWAVKLIGWAGSTYGTLSATQAIWADVLASAAYGFVWENGEDADWSTDISKRFSSAVWQGVLWGVLGTVMRWWYSSKGINDILERSRWIPEENTMITKGEGFYALTRGDMKAQQIIDASTGNPVFRVLDNNGVELVQATNTTPEYIRSMIRRGESSKDIAEALHFSQVLKGTSDDIVEAYQKALFYAPKWAKVSVAENLVDTAGNRVAGKVENGAIILDKELADKTVAMHEVTHAYISKMPEAQRTAMFVEAQKVYGTSNLVDLEERIADELYSYTAQKSMRTTTLSGKVKETVLDIYNRLNGVVGKDAKLKSLYDTIASGRQYTAETRMWEFYKRATNAESSATVLSPEQKTKLDAIKSGELPESLKRQSREKVDEIIAKIEQGAPLTRARDRAIAAKIYEAVWLEKPPVLRQAKMRMDAKTASALTKEVDDLARGYESTINANMKELRKITSAAENWKVSIDQVMPLIDGIASMRDKTRLISLATKWGKPFLVGDALKTFMKEVESVYSTRMWNINRIRSLGKKIMRSQSMDARYKEELKWFLEDYSFKKQTAEVKKTIDVLKKMEVDPSSLDAAERELYLDYVLNSEKRELVGQFLNKRNIYDMDNAELDALLTDMNNSYFIGVDIKKVNTEAWKAERQVEANGYTPNAISYGKEYKNTENNSFADNMADMWETLKNGTGKFNLYQTRASQIFDRMGLKNFFKKYETAILRHDLKSAKVKMKFNEIEETYKLTPQDYIRIDLHLYSKDKDAVHNIAYQLEQTGINYLDNTPVAPEEIFSTIAKYQSDDFLETEGQKVMAKFMRETIDEAAETARNTAYTEKNKVIKHDPNYWSMRRDTKADPKAWDANDTFDEMTGEFLKTSGFLQKSINIAQIEDRTWAAYFLKYNARENFINTFENLSHFGEILPTLREMNSVIERMGTAKLGKDGMEYMKKWVDLVARRWRSLERVSPIWRGAEVLAKNFKKWVLWFNPKTIAIQVTNIPMARWVIGWGVDFEANVALAAASREVREQVAQKSGIVALKRTELTSQWWWDRLTDKAFVPMQAVDGVTSVWVWKTVYDRGISKWLSEADAIIEAEHQLRKVMTVADAGSKSMFVAEHSRGLQSLFSMFLDPSTVIYSNLMNKSELSSSMAEQLLWVAWVSTAMYYTIGNLVEWGMRGEWGDRDIFDIALRWELKSNGEMKQGWAEKLSNLMLMNVPIASMISGRSQYSEWVLQFLNDTRTGTLQLVKGLTNDDDEAFNKGVASMIKGLMMWTWVPGANWINKYQIKPAITWEPVSATSWESWSPLFSVSGATTRKPRTRKPRKPRVRRTKRKSSSARRRKRSARAV